MANSFSKYDTRKVSDEGAWVDIRVPIDPETGVEGLKIAEFKVAGRDSKIIKRRQQELARKRQNKKNISQEEEMDDILRTLAAATIDWRMIGEEGKPLESGYILIEEDGEPIKISIEAAYQLYKEFDWVAEQVAEVLGDRVNFMREYLKN